MKIVRFKLDGVERQVRKPDSVVDLYVDWMKTNRPERTDIEVSDAPLTIHERFQEIARRLNGFRQGGGKALDMSDLLEDHE